MAVPELFTGYGAQSGETWTNLEKVRRSANNTHSYYRLTRAVSIPAEAV